MALEINQIDWCKSLTRVFCRIALIIQCDMWSCLRKQVKAKIDSDVLLMKNYELTYIILPSDYI